MVRPSPDVWFVAPGLIVIVNEASSRYLMPVRVSCAFASPLPADAVRMSFALRRASLSSGPCTSRLSAINPKGSVNVTGLFPTYAYRFWPAPAGDWSLPQWAPTPDTRAIPTNNGAAHPPADSHARPFARLRCTSVRSEVSLTRLDARPSI